MNRSAEILFSLATVAARVEGPSSFPVAELFGLITSSRRDLALFQHHDGITGTAKNFVVQDYGNRCEILIYHKSICIDCMGSKMLCCTKPSVRNLLFMPECFTNYQLV